MRAVFILPLLSLGMACAPAFGDEVLLYSLKWPTGIAMGHGELKTTQGSAPTDKPSRSDFSVDVSLPGVPVTGIFSSHTDTKGCTNDFTKKYEFGFRKSLERTVIDGGKARRETTNGGKSTFDAGACPKDALAFLQFLRAELAAGRKPASQKILFGAEYMLTLEYPKPTDAMADTVKVILKGPAAQHTFEIDFLRDAGRTPVRVRVPMAMGKFVLELVH